MEFKVGDRVRLKDYTNHDDHRNHDDEIATFLHDHGVGCGGKYRIQWADGVKSCCRLDNLKKVGCRILDKRRGKGGEKMAHFSIGDRVERLEGEYFDMEEGDSGVVCEVSPKGNLKIVGWPSDGYHIANRFKKVGETKMATERKRVWEVIVINKESDEVILREIVVDGDEKSVCSKASITWHAKLKDIMFDNLHYIAREIGSFESKDKKK